MYSSLVIYFFALFLLGYSAPVVGLTVYRIGGENLHRPELDAPYEFVQLSWADADPARHGRTERLELDPDFIRPQQLDPSVNLAPSIKERGGQVLTKIWSRLAPHQEDDFYVFDQDPNTIYLGDGHFAAHGTPEKSLIFDFGAPLPLERIRFNPRKQYLTNRFVESFMIGVNDGDPVKDGTREFRIGRSGQLELDFDIVYDVVENTKADIHLDLPAMPIRRLLFQAQENTRGIWEIAEIEIYGRGFAPFASYVTNLIDLGSPASLGQLQWSGYQDKGGRIDLSMRSGLDDDPNTYWRNTFRGSERTRFDQSGQPLQLDSYNSLELGEQDGVTHDTENWAFWGPAYDFAAGRGAMVGNGPRRYVQVRADFTSTQQASSRLDYVQFAVSIPPVASRAVAEIVPNAVPPGRVTPFTYKLKPILKNDDLGFDRISIDTPSRPVQVDQVRISGQPVDFELNRIDSEGFVVGIPRIHIQRTEELIEVDFRAEVFTFGTVFSGRIFDSQRPHEVPQSITPGDADGLEDSNRLSVDLTRLGVGTIGTLSLNPPVFSPNGDGINDGVQIEYDLLNLVGPVWVCAGLYDLTGQLLGVIYEDRAASGRFAAQWDGRDEGGRLFPPGLYILRLTVDADSGQDTRQSVLALAY